MDLGIFLSIIGKWLEYMLESLKLKDLSTQ
jgi:hypothetical protein